MYLDCTWGGLDGIFSAAGGKKGYRIKPVPVNVVLTGVSLEITRGGARVGKLPSVSIMCCHSRSRGLGFMEID